MSRSLEELAQDIVARASGGEAIEAWLSHSRDFEVKVYEGAVETISSAEPRGAGIRVLEKGRAGFAFTTDLTPSGLDEVVRIARDAADLVTPDEWTVLAPPWVAEPADIPGLLSDRFETITPDDKVKFAIELEKATAGIDPRVRTVEEAGYSDSWTEVALASSTGIAGRYVRTDAWCHVVAIATEGDDTEVAFDFDLGRDLESLDLQQVASSAVSKAVGVLGARKIPSGRMPIVLDPYTAGQFLGVIGSALTGEAVQKGRSLFAGKLGEKVAAPGIALIDDGRATGAPGSAPWDAEGVPTQQTTVIEGGVLRSYLYDLHSAKRDGTSSTGNGSRAGFKSGPHPAPTNMHLAPTGETRAEIMTRAGEAFLVQNFHGVHSGANPISGDFSVGATGRMLRDGIEAEPVKEVTIAAPMLDILARIVAVGDDLRWLPFGGSYGGATFLIEEMTVAGS